MAEKGFIRKLKFETWLFIAGVIVAVIVVVFLFFKTPVQSYTGTVKEMTRTPVKAPSGEVIGHEQVVSFTDGTTVIIDNYVPWKEGCTYEIKYKDYKDAWFVESHKSTDCP
jgi:hypothetical protein